MIRVGHAVVAKIVRNRTHNHRDGIQFVQLGPLVKTAFCQENEGHLEDIRGVNVIVILHISPIAFIYLADKARDFHLVQLGALVQAQLPHKVDSQDGETLFATDVLTKADRVEIDLLRVLQLVRV